MNSFEPIRLEEKQNGFVLGVYGRTYEFIDSVMPTRITTVEKSILYSPITLHAMFGDRKGEWQEFKYYIVSYDEEQCVIILSANTRKVSPILVTYAGIL